MGDVVSSSIISSIVGILGLLAGSIGTAVRVTYSLSRIKEELSQKINDEREELQLQLAENHTMVMKNFGDSLAALREKIRETELWGRDNYVDKQDFYRVIDGMAGRIDVGFTKLETKLDKLQDLTKGN